jgi:hypothetical protein
MTCRFCNGASNTCEFCSGTQEGTNSVPKLVINRPPQVRPPRPAKVTSNLDDLKTALKASEEQLEKLAQTAAAATLVPAGAPAYVGSTRPSPKKPAVKASVFRRRRSR